MLNFLINYCLFIFICYAAAYPAKAILGIGRRKARRTARRRPRAAARRRATVIPLRCVRGEKEAQARLNAA